MKVVFLTVNFLDSDFLNSGFLNGGFLDGGFTVLFVAILEGYLIGGGARGRGMARGGTVLGLVTTMFPVHKTTHYYMHTF